MEGVLEVLLTILVPNTDASEIEKNSAPAETSMPNTQLVVAEQPNNDQSLLTEKLNLSYMNSDVNASVRTVENLSDLMLSADMQSASLRNNDHVDVHSTSTDHLDSYQKPSQPQFDLHLSSTGVVLESSLVKSATVGEKEVVDAQPVTEDSLTHSLPPLSSVPLTVPFCPPRYLQLTFLPDEKLVSISIAFYSGMVNLWRYVQIE